MTEVLRKCPRLGCSFGGTKDEVDSHVEKMDARGLHESQISDNPKPFCIGCIRTPDEIDEYVMTNSIFGPDEYVRREEGTYNSKNGHFLCTSCYVAAGMPTSPMGWKAP